MDASNRTSNGTVGSLQSRRDGSSPSVTSSRAASRMAISQRPTAASRPGSSIRIRRLTSMTSTTDDDAASLGHDSTEDLNSAGDSAVTGRRRSLSEPQRLLQPYGSGPQNLSQVRTSEHHLSEMPAISEYSPNSSFPTTPGSTTVQFPSLPPQTAPAATRPRGLSNLHTAGSGLQATFGAGDAARANRGLTRMRSATVRSRAATTAQDEYDEDVLGLLDLVDPEVQTLSTLTNVQNSLFVPDLGRLINRRPTYELTSRPSTARMAGALQGVAARSRAGTVRSNRTSTDPDDLQQVLANAANKKPSALGRRTSISSQLTERHWAVLPHGETLDGWTDAEIDELNDHVRHLLHSRREGFKRGWRGFKKYISKPLGLFVFLYAVLVTLFGATWVIFLIGWIYVGGAERQSYAIDVVDNILVALFALMGDGLAPFRAVDTYHMCFIAHYHHLTWRLRKAKNLPDLQNHNDLPRRRVTSAGGSDLEAGQTVDDLTDKMEYSVLTPLQERRLQYHEAKFSKSHTFYKPHETATHHAFPLRLLVAVVVLLDFHSLFQVALGTCTWSINYHVRPQALTATILACSLTCNITAGVLVSIGDKRTRKKEVLDRIFRQTLTQEAISKILKRQAKHERVNYDAIEEEEGIFNDGENISDDDDENESTATPSNERRKRSLDIPRITKSLFRHSQDLPRSSKEISVADRHGITNTASHTS